MMEISLWMRAACSRKFPSRLTSVPERSEFEHPRSQPPICRSSAHALRAPFAATTVNVAPHYTIAAESPADRARVMFGPEMPAPDAVTELLLVLTSAPDDPFVQT